MCMMQPRNPCLLFFFCLPLLSRLLHDFRPGLLTWESTRMCNQPTSPRSCCTCPAAPQRSAPRTRLHLGLCRARQHLASRYFLWAKPKPKLNIPSQSYTTTITFPGDVLGSRFGAASAVPGLTVGSSSARIIKNSISGRHVRRFSPQGHLIQM